PIFSLPIHRWARNRTRRRGFQDARFIPPPLWADYLVRVDASADGDGIRIALDIGDDLDIVEIGKGEVPSSFHHAKAEAAPEIHQPLLRMAINAGVTLAAAKLERRPHQLKGGAGFAEFGAYRQALDLGEIGEITHPKAAGRFMADIAQKMGG